MATPADDLAADPTRECNRGDGSGEEGSRDGVDHFASVHRPRVLIVDESVRADLFNLWLDQFRVTTVNSRRELIDAFDRTVAVTVVRNELSSDTKSTVESLIAAKAPFCRTIVTSSERVEVMFPAIDYDVSLTEPTNRMEFREIVGRLLLRAQYDANLRAFYECSMGAANREVLLDADALAVDERHRRLSRRMETLKSRLDAIVARFDADDLDAVQQSIRPDVAFGTANKQKNKRRGEKYRPDKCVGCGIEWGVNHGGKLGAGYKRLGAFVWECAECGAVQNLPDPSHRRVAWR